METDTQKEFDQSYGYVRALLLRGKCKVDDAKAWLHTREEQIADGIVKDLTKKLSQQYGKNPDRELEGLRKMFGSSNEDDDV